MSDLRHRGAEGQPVGAKVRGAGDGVGRGQCGFNDSVERAQGFIRKTGMHYPALFDGSGKITEPYALVGVPTVIIADKKGVVRFRNFVAPDISEEQFARLTAD